MNKAESQVITVGIGASAGGLEAFKVLLECLAVDTGLSFVIIQHLAAGQESMLTDILSRFTPIPVQAVKDRMRVEPNHVYVIPPGTIITMENRVLKLNPKGKSLKPIDTFFVSLAEDLKARSIGVVLSGTGSDGTEGLKAIKAQGGITFAQTPSSSQYPDMPQNAISADVADFVLTPDEIARQLQKVARNPVLARTEIEKREKNAANMTITKKATVLTSIFAMLKSNFNVDFSHYKETVVNRRVCRRMVINHIEKMAKYVEYLGEHPDELESLYNDMLIGVTSFFREPETFVALKETVFPELIKNHSAKEPIRVWIPGCSTGEETYSFAITLQEYLDEKYRVDFPFQIFGTDVNEKNIEKARQGIYSKTIESDIAEKRLKHFFTTNNGNSQISKNIRDKCVFAKQDVTADPPFSNMDIIICRNMLIYFDEYLHERVLPTLHYALKLGGFLVLGQSESIGKFSQLFDPLNKRGPIYVKKIAQPSVTFGLQSSAPYAKPIAKREVEKKDILSLLRDEVDHLLVSEYVPAALLVNANSDVLVFRGNIAPYVLPESGLASLNVTKMTRKELRSEVQTMIYRAKKEKKPVKENAVRFEFGGEQKTTNIQVIPLHISQFEEPFFLLLFEDVSSAAELLRQTMELATTPEGQESAKNHQIRELREELESTKQSLQRIIETQEATNEELRTTMEEAQSSNEELQSTNEELETAKEELQSSNEELKTLNDEVKNRNQTLAQLNDDLTNLNRNVDSAIVIVDKSLKVRLFSPSAQNILNLSQSMVGLPITALKLAVIVENLGETVSEVISKLSSVTKEVKDAQDHYYEMRVQPYIKQEDKIDGAVLAFSDITQRKARNERQIERLAKFPFENPNPVLRVDRKGIILYGNPAADSLFTEWNSKIGNNVPQSISHEVEEALASKKKIEVEKTCGSREFSFLYVPITRENYVNIYANDITERKEAEESLKQNEQTFLELIERAPFGIYVVNSQFQIEHMNKGSQDGAFRNVRPVIGRDFSEAMHILWPESTASEILARFRHTLETGEPYYSPPFVHPRHDVEIVESYEWELQRIRLPNGQFGVICYYFDSTKLRETERKLIEAQVKLKEYAINLEHLVEKRTKQLKDAERLATIGSTAGMVGHDIRNPLQAITSDVYLANSDLSTMSEGKAKEGIKESLKGIQLNVEYINKIVQDLQDYARPIKPTATEMNLETLCENVLVKNGVPENIKASCQVERKAKKLLADPDVLKRILANLVSNAIQAMPEGGKLALHAYQEAEVTIITVADTGVGIPEEIKSKLFTPLFTTKSKGQGFGLAVVKRMTDALGGTITYESEIGKGTKFILRLPKNR